MNEVTELDPSNQSKAFVFAKLQNLLVKYVLETDPVKTDLNKKLDPKEKAFQTFNIDAQGFRKTKNDNPPTWEIGVTS